MRDDEIRVIVTGKKARLERTVPLNTGNAGSYRVRFLIDPDDRVWANRTLSASFRAVTHLGAVTTGMASVGVDCTAKIPYSVLRERAARLEVGLKGVAQNHSDASTNMVNLGPVAQGAGGDGFFPDCPDAPPCHAGHAPQQCGNLERLWREVMARLAGWEPHIRRLVLWFDGAGKDLRDAEIATDADIDALF